MIIELTPEQSQALQGHPDGPIGIVDPTSQREYVLVSREQFDKLRPAELAVAATQHAPIRPAAPVPQRLADLPTPPEVTEEARRRYARRWKVWGGKSFARIEQELKLQYYYGGRLICCLRTREGPVIVIVHQGDDNEFHQQYRALPPEQRARAISMSLPDWTTDDVELSSAFYYHESDHLTVL